VKCIAFIFLYLTAFLTMEPLLGAKGILPVNGMLACSPSSAVRTRILDMAGMAIPMNDVIAPSLGITASGDMPCCKHKMHCSRQATQQNGKEDGPGKGCQGNGCNPFMACAYGNFYLLEKNSAALTVPALIKEKRTPANDNRLFSHHSESWHPPEFIIV
jgi:hypothetical protein